MSHRFQAAYWYIPTHDMVDQHARALFWQKLLGMSGGGEISNQFPQALDPYFDEISLQKKLPINKAHV